MQHRKNKLLEINTGAKSKNVYIRQLLTNLVRNGKTTTTAKRAQVLKAYADAFFARLVANTATYSEKDALRENIRFIKSEIFGEAEGKKVINELLPKFVESGKKSGFVSSYKLGYRLGDGAEKILLKLS
ncbi:MAG: L17 family ribosomal protein [Candidatus Absconditabacteria bacterium]|nr:L17 family ribosomal protein [Candidatus Absconditabacteria bacterium]MDD3868534.1 L17 family ribosomal protein [Candidatus Absconditabacteria bacterium]MDD4714098.1 L17 family ribosomal protein [Candidatus Absconditabacteria bacterium]